MLYVGDTGKVLRLNLGFNASSYTELSIVITKADGSSVTKTTANGVVLGVVDVTDDDLGALNANEYIEYPIESGVISVAGIYKVYAIYTNSTPEPDHVYYGQTATFNVYTPGLC